MNPSVYTTPANAFNTLTVDFDAQTEELAQFSTKSLPRLSKNVSLESDTALSDQQSVDNCLKSLSCANFNDIPTETDNTLVKRINSNSSVLTPYNCEVLEGTGSLQVEEVDELPTEVEQVCSKT